MCCSPAVNEPNPQRFQARTPTPWNCSRGLISNHRVSHGSPTGNHAYRVVNHDRGAHFTTRDDQRIISEHVYMQLASRCHLGQPEGNYIISAESVADVGFQHVRRNFLETPTTTTLQARTSSAFRLPTPDSAALIWSAESVEWKCLCGHPREALA